MPLSPSSSAQAAREAVAGRLKELRADAGITGPELATRCGWSHPKTYRIEAARTPPSADDIRRWCEACGAQDQADDIIAQSRTAESMYVEWRRKVRTGLKQLQNSYVPLFKATKLFRVYSPTMVPGLLQTEGYAHGLMTSITRFRDIPDDIAAAVAARLERSRIIHESGHQFAMVVEEPVLYYQLGDPEAMAAQLGYLLTAGALPQVSLGIIPSAVSERPMWPQEVFHVYDESLVSVELLAARVQVTQPSEIAMYIRAFEELRAMAVYGAEARALILRAIDALG
ncbi:helix-turn-helix transcriptional regulator [Streptomyces sp. NPDC048281]|uniref:helix-turn-helix domain-containing protein n=1 Tax=Streptomyces sp. NPDC048281 TaxID=3154715 RepID=UPI00342357BD